MQTKLKKRSLCCIHFPAASCFALNYYCSVLNEKMIVSVRMIECIKNSVCERMSVYLIKDAVSVRMIECWFK